MSNYRKNLISTLMLVWNAERFLVSALESLINQTYLSWEVLLIDDASTDFSCDIISDYTNKDDRICFIGRNQERKGINGIGKLRNRCLSVAKGEYVAVLDADDIRYPDSYSSCIQEFQKDASLTTVSTQYDEIDEFGQILPPSTCLANRKKITLTKQIVDITQLVGKKKGGVDCPIAPCATMIEREAIDNVCGYTEKWRYNQDSNIYRRIARLQGTKFGLIGESLSAYRVHGGQMTKAKKVEGWKEPTVL